MQSKPRLVDLRGGRSVPPPAPGDIRTREPRRSALKQKRRRLRAIVTASICVCTLMSAYALHAASYTNRFTYQSVKVTEIERISAQSVQDFVEKKLQESATGFISGRNIFVFKYEPLSQEIVANFPSIKFSEVSRDTSLGNGLSIRIEERTPFAEWCEKENQCYFIDTDGVVFAPVSGATSTLPSSFVFTGALSTSSIAVQAPPYGEIFAAEHFTGINAMLQMLRSAGVTPLGAKLENDTDFSIPLAEGFYLKASFGEDPQILVKNVSLILSSNAIKGKTDQLEYVDLRFGNRVYYKFKNEAQTSPTL